jgi:hypothetical protein
MPNLLITGRLRAVETGAIVLTAHVRILIPPDISITDFPIGCSLTVVVHEGPDKQIIAERITRYSDL